MLRRHVGDGITYFKYHGLARRRNADALPTKNIVLTTYHTLASEYKDKRSLLHNINWFRVVLDEGTQIFGIFRTS